MALGTTFSTLGLPTTAHVTYNDATTAAVAIASWGGDHYVKDTAGTYVLQAVLTLTRNATHLQVVFSEKVTKAIAETITNYKIS